MNDDRIYQAALDWANEIRVKRGLRPLVRLPTGGVTTTSCPLARAIDGRVGNRYCFSRDPRAYATGPQTPTVVMSFIHRHDGVDAWGLQAIWIPFEPFPDDWYAPEEVPAESPANRPERTITTERELALA